MRMLRLAALIVGIMGATVGLLGRTAQATPLVGSLPAATAAGQNPLVSDVYWRRAYYYRRPVFYRRYYYRPYYRPRIVCRIRYGYWGPRRVCFRRW